VRVLTLNLWGLQGAWDERRAVLAEGLRELRPDVAALQEAVKTERYDQAADLLGPGYHIAHQSGRSADGVGASIASRWPLGKVREADLRAGARMEPAQRWIGGVAAAEVLAPHPVGPLLFVHHKPSWQRGFERERELQAAAAARFVEGNPATMSATCRPTYAVGWASG
jgi:exonuclease III